MTTYDMVHLLLHAAGGTVEGRTKLQKLVYFAAALTGDPEALGYRAHYFGPYSPEVAGAVDDLRGLRFLEQKNTAYGAVDPNGFEVTRYDFSLTKEGEQIAEEKASAHPKDWEQIKQAFEKLKQTGEVDYVKLSIAAKAYFIYKQKRQQQNSPVTKAELFDWLSQSRWQVNSDQANEAGKLLATLGLMPYIESS